MATWGNGWAPGRTLQRSGSRAGDTAGTAWGSPWENYPDQGSGSFGGGGGGITGIYTGSLRIKEGVWETGPCKYGYHEETLAPVAGNVLGAAVKFRGTGKLKPRHREDYGPLEPRAR